MGAGHVGTWACRGRWDRSLIKLSIDDAPQAQCPNLRGRHDAAVQASHITVVELEGLLKGTVNFGTCVWYCIDRHPAHRQVRRERVYK